MGECIWRDQEAGRHVKGRKNVPGDPEWPEIKPDIQAEKAIDQVKGFVL